MKKNIKLAKNIKSFVLRQGRLTQGQKKFLQLGADDYLLSNEVLTIEEQKQLIFSPLALQQKITQINPCELVFCDCQQEEYNVLEIGFGNGQFLYDQCLYYSHKNFFGIEVHLPGIAKLIGQAMAASIKNLKLIRCDAIITLQYFFPKNFFDEIYILFPDPWHKRRHHKRRLINSFFIQLLGDVIKDKGQLFIATDWQTYAESIEQTVNEITNFTQILTINKSRNHTHFEKRGLSLNHQIYDFQWQYVQS